MWVWLGWRCRIVDTKSDSQGLNPLGYLQNWSRFQRPTNSIKSDTISPKISKLGVGVNQFLREREKLMASSTAANAENQEQFIESNPINSCLFDWLPRYILSRNDVPAALKLILMVMYGALRKDCKVTFRVATLAARTGLSEPTVKRAIKKGRKLGLFITIETGRALRFRLIDQSNKLIHEVDQNDPSLIIEQKKDLKETTTAPKPKPKQNPKPKSPPEPPAEIAVAQLNEYKKSIHPDIIAAGLSDETILQVCDGADYQKIIWASDKALKSHVKNKPGYFRRMMELKIIRSNPVKSPQIRLEKVPYPDFYSVPKEHTDKIECYNRNCGHTTCPTILINAEPSEACIKYCPFLNSRRTES